jgi:hypothetical protein
MPYDDPALLSPDEQLRALAGILAAGLLRLRRTPIPAGTAARPGPENSSESGQDCLELGGDLRLSVHNG